MPPIVTVVVATRDRASWLRRCLESITVSSRLLGAPVEVIVGDNGSTDDTAQVVASLEASSGLSVRYVREPRPGKSWALNSAIAVAAGDIVAFTDDDIVVDPRWLTEIVAEFTRDADLGLLAGAVDPLPGVSGRVAVTRSRTAVALGGARALEGLVLGCNLAIRRAVLHRIKGFDTRLGPGSKIGCEDIDFVHRALRSGARGRYSPTSVVYHEPAPRARRVINLRGWGAFYTKHIVRGDRQVAKFAWWEMSRIVRDFWRRPSEGRATPREELALMIVGATIMLWRMAVSVASRQDAEAPR